ncbi:hypothetical protein, partial [Desulfofundulus sp.]|uniref:hypothetical protein n=1 Tax=Desulfofundulus sp. TaxID=2282750 RepID=UPI003C71C321
MITIIPCRCPISGQVHVLINQIYRIRDNLCRVFYPAFFYGWKPLLSGGAAVAEVPPDFCGPQERGLFWGS